jgi:hypothetical protein
MGFALDRVHLKRACLFREVAFLDGYLNTRETSHERIETPLLLAYERNGWRGNRDRKTPVTGANRERNTNVEDDRGRKRVGFVEKYWLPGAHLLSRAHNR